MLQHVVPIDEGADLALGPAPFTEQWLAADALGGLHFLVLFTFNIDFFVYLCVVFRTRILHRRYKPER